MTSFSIKVAKESLKFSAAHFIAYPGFREPLHGHNYQVGVELHGQLNAHGYVLDFGLVKRLLKALVDQLDERTIIPAASECLTIERCGAQVRVRYGVEEFVFPAADVVLLAIAHSSAEELARYLWNELCAELRRHDALAGVETLELWVAEGPGQAAHYRQAPPAADRA